MPAHEWLSELIGVFEMRLPSPGHNLKIESLNLDFNFLFNHRFSLWVQIKQRRKA